MSDLKNAVIFLLCCIFFAAAQMPTNGLLAYYPLDGDGSDHSGNGFHGAVTGPLAAADRFGTAGNCMSFDGVDDSVIVPHDDAQICSTVSVSVWVNVAGTTNDHQELIGKWDWSEGSSWVLELAPDGAKTMWTTGINGYTSLIHPTPNITFGWWHHYVGVYDGHTKLVYLDGLVVDSVTVSASVFEGLDLSTGPVRMGCHSESREHNWYRGLLDDVRIYRRALSRAEIEVLYDEGGWCSLYTPTLIPVASPTLERRPLLTWHPVGGASVYTLVMDSMPDFPQPFIVLPLADTSFVPGADLPFGTTYWRVRADSYRFSPSSSFRIQDPRVPFLIPYEPKVTQERRPTLRWHPVAGATSYTLVVDETSSFDNPTVSILLSDTTFTPSADLAAVATYWRVKSDLVDAWSEIDSFYIQPDTIPFLIRFSGDTLGSTTPTFKWHPVAGASAYRIEAANNPWFSGAISVPVSDTSFTPLVPLELGPWYWRVSCSRDYSLYPPTDSLVVDQTVQNRLPQCFADPVLRVTGTARPRVFDLRGRRVAATRRQCSQGIRVRVHDGITTRVLHLVSR